MFVRDPCGIICVIVTYLAVLYADYVVMQWIVLHTMLDTLWGSFNAVLFNFILTLFMVSHLRAVFSDPGVVPLPQSKLDIADIHSKQSGKVIDLVGPAIAPFVLVLCRVRASRLDGLHSVRDVSSSTGSPLQGVQALHTTDGPSLSLDK